MRKQLQHRNFAPQEPSSPSSADAIVGTSADDHDSTTMVGSSSMIAADTDDDANTMNTVATASAGSGTSIWYSYYHTCPPALVFIVAVAAVIISMGLSTFFMYWNPISYTRGTCTVTGIGVDRAVQFRSVYYGVVYCRQDVEEAQQEQEQQEEIPLQQQTPIFEVLVCQSYFSKTNAVTCALNNFALNQTITYAHTRLKPIIQISGSSSYNYEFTTLNEATRTAWLMFILVTIVCLIPLSCTCMFTCAFQLKRDYFENCAEYLKHVFWVDKPRSIGSFSHVGKLDANDDHTNEKNNSSNTNVPGQFSKALYSNIDTAAGETIQWLEQPSLTALVKSLPFTCRLSMIMLSLVQVSLFVSFIALVLFEPTYLFVQITLQAIFTVWLVNQFVGMTRSLYVITNRQLIIVSNKLFTEQVVLCMELAQVVNNIGPVTNNAMTRTVLFPPVHSGAGAVYFARLGTKFEVGFDCVSNAHQVNQIIEQQVQNYCASIEQAVTQGYHTHV